MRSGTKNRATTVRERFSAEDTTPLPYGRGSDKTSHTPSKSVCEKRDEKPSRDREGAVFRGGYRTASLRARLG